MDVAAAVSDAGLRAAPEEQQAAGKHARGASAPATARPQSRPVFCLVLDLSLISGALIGRATMKVGYERLRECARLSGIVAFGGAARRTPFDALLRAPRRRAGQAMRI